MAVAAYAQVEIIGHVLLTSLHHCNNGKARTLTGQGEVFHIESPFFKKIWAYRSTSGV
jgi:hypothetical protein